MVLLDVNVLLALGWPSHVHHARVHAWMTRHASAGWCTCAITQGAFVRISCQPAFSPYGLSVEEAWATLEGNLAHPGHRLLSMDASFGEALNVCTGGVIGHRQITDALLLTTAARAGARLLTFDGGVRQLLATEDERKRCVQVLA